jgi:DNA polymerase delta, subunit 4
MQAAASCVHDAITVSAPSALRLRRWNRAERLGLNPPSDIKQYLEEYGEMGESLWHNRL